MKLDRKQFLITEASIQEHCNNLLERKDFKEFVGKDVFFSSLLNERRNLYMQSIGNCGGYGHDYDLTSNTNYFVISQEELDLLKIGKLSKSLAEVTALRIKSGNMGNIASLVTITEEVFLKIVKLHNNNIGLLTTISNNIVINPENFIDIDKLYTQTLLDIQFNMKNKNFVALDIELADSSLKHSICSIGLAKVVDGEVIEKKQWLINPLVKFNYINTKIHGISSNTVKNALTFVEAWKQVEEYLNNNLVVLHNANNADISWICSTLEYYQLPYPNFQYVCTLVLSKNLLRDKLKKFSLSDLALHFDIYLQHHDALSDAIATAYLFLALSSNQDIDEFMITIGAKYGCVFERGKENFTIREIVDTKPKRPTTSSKILPMNTMFNNDVVDNNHIFYQKYIVITGELSVSRKEAVRMIEDVGGIFADKPNKKVSYLVVGTMKTDSTNKFDTVEKINKTGGNIKVISESEFFYIINTGQQSLV